MDFLFEDTEKLANFTSCNDINPSGIGRFGISYIFRYIFDNQKNIIN